MTLNPPRPEWRPGTRLKTLRLRAGLHHAVRKYFARHGVMEVETPALVRHGVTDVQLRNFECRSSLSTESAGYLHTSPEYHMKRLLAWGAPDIYQVCKVFRDGESGRRHHPEFTMIEWYRLGFTLEQIIDDSCALLTACAMAAGKTAPHISQSPYQQVFLRYTGIDPLSTTPAALRNRAGQLLGSEIDARLIARLGDDPQSWQDLLMSHVVIPALPPRKLVVIHHYPAGQAALARIDPADERVAERFEVFFGGLELANGYRELSDPHEQRQRFDNDRRRRAQCGLPDVEPDPGLLSALDHGLPECSGVAVGFDRLLMCFGDCSTITQTMSFSD